MRKFKEFLEAREDSEEKSNYLYKIIRLAWRDHHHQTIDFLKKLSKVNPELQSELEKIIDLKIDGPLTNHKSRDSEVVMPPSSDMYTSSDF